MQNKYYHIHLICAPEDQITMQDGLALFMENRAFLTRDLNQGDHESASYSRRCIDNCDYITMLVGDSYGKLSNTGVSQLHLSYIYAKTKSKPILILLKLQGDTSKLSRQLLDFTGMIERDNSDSIYYYDEDVRMQTFVEPAYRKFLKEHGTATGWIKASAATNTKSKTTKGYIRKLTALKTAKATLLASSKPNNTVTETELVNIIENPEHIDNSIVVSFTTHAYEAGNLSDIELSTSLRWRDVLESVKHFSEPFSLSTLRQKTNDLLHTQALPLVQETSRGVHAVSRTQITDKDFQILQIQLIKMGWLRVVKNSETNQELLTFNSKSKGLL